MSRDFLRGIEIFCGLPDDDLDRLLQMAALVSLEPGEVLIEEGEPGDTFYVLLEGELKVTRCSGDQDVLLSIETAGALIGEMSLLGAEARTATVRATRDSRLLALGRESFHTVLSSSNEAAMATLQLVTRRLKSREAILLQHDKMAALGTLTAGLAHELNNPASSMARGSAHLYEIFGEWHRLSIALGALSLDPARQQLLDDLRDDLLRRTVSMIALDPLTRSEAEEQLQSWLESHGVVRAWDFAPSLVACGWDVATLDATIQQFAASQQSVVASWLGASSIVYSLLEDMRNGALHISEVVRAIKNYTYHDQAPRQQINIHHGLDDTLLMQRYRLSRMRIVRDYAEDLPIIDAYGSELNQVWTNIITNALDATQEAGELTLRTSASDERVVVEITDNGPGIPPEAQKRIFDPFFTTKSMSESAGLGLYVAYKIVVDRHRGEISVRSRPGATTFRITLPIHLQEPAAVFG